jgi:enoyl-CoA hydratase
MAVHVERIGSVTVVSLDRPEVRNAVDAEHASLLTEAFEAFDADSATTVAVLHGIGGNFCAGADLKALARGELDVGPPGRGPAGMGPTRLLLGKPVIASVEGYAVAGGLELACWADLRVADPNAIFGVFCRRWGVPLIDGGTVRLPRLIGQSHALDMILTGRPVDAGEAIRMGLVNWISKPGAVLAEAIELASLLGTFPQTCMRQDRLSVYEQQSLELGRAIENEWRHGGISLADGTLAGAERFSSGSGRHGSFDAVNGDVSG